MIISKTIIAAIGVLSLSQAAFAGPVLNSNVTSDIMANGLKVDTSTNISGTVLNGKSTVYAKNAIRHHNGLCAYTGNFIIYNDSNVNPGTFLTTMHANGAPIVHSNTTLGITNIKSFDFTVYLKPGKNKLIVKADAQNVINESNEKNNRLIKYVNVVGNCNGTKNKLPSKKSFKSSLRVTPKKSENIGTKQPTIREAAVLDFARTGDS